MKLMPSNVRPTLTSDPVPSPTTADRIRDAVSARCGRVEALDRGHAALDLAALAIDALHANLNGQATCWRGPHSSEYWRQALRGEHPICIEDLARLAVDPAREAHQALHDALAVLAGAIGYELVPQQGGLLTATEATVAMVDAGRAVETAVLRAQANDGRIDQAEADQIAALVPAVERSLVQLKAGLHGLRRRSE